jgi:hypothetical protein
MDPLSITASVIAVVEASRRVVSGGKKLHGLRIAPKKLWAVMNEVCTLFGAIVYP